MIKYYAKECDPEFTEDDLFYSDKEDLEIMDDTIAENIIIGGNREFKSYEPKGLEDLQKTIENFNSDLRGYYGKPEKITTVVNWYFKKHNGKNWSKHELKLWKDVADLTESYSSENEKEAFKLALFLITGKEWRRICLRGCSQRDWQYAYFSETLNKWTEQYVEMCYFNTGSRFDIYTSKEDLENCDNACESFYIDGYKAKETLCRYLGCKDSELELHSICGSHTYTKYDYEII